MYPTGLSLEDGRVAAGGGGSRRCGVCVRVGRIKRSAIRGFSEPRDLSCDAYSLSEGIENPVTDVGRATDAVHETGLGKARDA
jgi:hypothetical protein